VDVSARPIPSDFDQVVFAITVRGYAELRNDKSVLTLQDRTVLTLIDGVCPVAQYVPFLSAFEPVKTKLHLLEDLGLIRRVGQVAKEAVDRFDQQVATTEKVSSWQSISAFEAESGFVPMIPRLEDK
jgi:hypothetical protein